MKRWLVLLMTPAAALLLRATTVVPMSVEQMTRASTHVVDAIALDSAAQWNPEHTLIFTYTRFEVRRTLKGQSPNRVLVRQLGGTVDGITQKVSGVRHWQAGEEAVLFLHPSSTGDGAMVVTGLMQGDFRVRRTADGQAFVSDGFPEAKQVQASSGETTTYRGALMRLNELEAGIKRAGTE